jgi:hypothetical protein
MSMLYVRPMRHVVQRNLNKQTNKQTNKTNNTFPKICCDLAGCDFKIVKNIIKEELNNDITYSIFITTIHYALAVFPLLVLGR